mgnify:CR=1 FL=1
MTKEIDPQDAILSLLNIPNWWKNGFHLLTFCSYFKNKMEKIIKLNSSESKFIKRTDVEAMSKVSLWSSFKPRNN